MSMFIKSCLGVEGGRDLVTVILSGIDFDNLYDINILVNRSFKQLYHLCKCYV